MSPAHGHPIWYELLTKDPQAARRFYATVVGWSIDEAPAPGSTMDYRMIGMPDGLVGGVFTLTDAMCQQGARPCWMMYLGVDDVDACCAAFQAAGGAVGLPAFDIPNVGRIAMVTDPQGAALYVMKPIGTEDSTACAPERAGHGAWHELYAADGPAATAFYGAQFGWEKAHAVDMGPMGVYQLWQRNGQTLGGIFTDPRFPQPAWLVYFRVDGIEAAAQRITQAGGQVVNGPMEVPGGGWIVNGIDPDGAMFALTGTR